MDDLIKITINNWAKYQKGDRRKGANHWWFSLSNSFIYDEDTYEMNAEERLVWIGLLSMASKRGSGELEIDLDRFSYATRIKKMNIQSALKKYEQLQWVRYHSCTKYSGSTVHNTIQNNTIQNNTNTYAQTKFERVCFDFQEIYKSYPRKIGKQKGIDRLSRSIKTQDGFERVKLALENYKNHLAKNNTPKEYIQHFSTWTSVWEEWLDPETGSANDFKFSGLTEDDIT